MTYEERVREVREWQAVYGMVPREDSVLTDRYARREVGMTAREVAAELAATDFVYKNTLYGEVIEAFMRGVAARLREEHPSLSWKATWNVVKFYGPPSLKLMCVEAAGVRIPPCPSLPR